MKLTITLLPSLLWPLSSAAPPPAESPPPGASGAPFGPAISALPELHGNQSSSSSSHASSSSSLPRCPAPLPHARSPLSPPPDYVATTGAREGQTSFCGASSFVDVGAAAAAGAAPPALDCAALADRVVPGLAAGYWRYDAARSGGGRNATPARRLLQSGACAFGVLSAALPPNASTAADGTGEGCGDGGPRADGGDGRACIRVGSQDVMDVVNEALWRFVANDDGMDTGGGGGAGCRNGEGHRHRPATGDIMARVARQRDAEDGQVVTLAAAGAMWCDDPGAMVNWALYHV
ncbi:hypothetical protein GGS23DRAFT_616934 [Durotheca rogersii]|uniref:uncharacterized protein n=1 Tax=Durotheca rogersii TaxID=419775 RepID=UPI00221FE9CA|nr:uncharacterized protein GGS23DRAFT_616934 [Durotheca rogersii]KAI5865823.1 hypothetical protein GGS23DRAFT_616934 [Durotheca rogersii]